MGCELAISSYLHDTCILWAVVWLQIAQHLILFGAWAADGETDGFSHVLTNAVTEQAVYMGRKMHLAAKVDEAVIRVQDPSLSRAVTWRHTCTAMTMVMNIQACDKLQEGMKAERWAT